MTEAMPPSLTPPTKAAKQRKPRAPKDPNAPVKPRAPRQNYGYHEAATIILVEGKEIKYRGARLAWFESVKPFAGKTVKEWEESRKGEEQPPRGWLRFFVQDGTVVLTGQPQEQKAA